MKEAKKRAYKPRQKSPLQILTGNLTRDQQICIIYKAGKTQAEIGALMNISRVRVQQILRINGLSARDSPKTPCGEKYAFIGTNVHKDIKKALVAEAARRKKSVSSLIEELIREELRL